MRYRGWHIFALIVILFSGNLALIAQSVQSTILGTVKDQGDALIVSAQVNVTKIDTGIPAKYIPDQSGDYLASDLPPGRYRVQATKDGFQKNVISDLTLAARQQLRVDVILAVGATQAEVTVDGSTAGAIETETPSIAPALRTESVMNLPVNTRASSWERDLTLPSANWMDNCMTRNPSPLRKAPSKMTNRCRRAVSTETSDMFRCPTTPPFCVFE